MWGVYGADAIVVLHFGKNNRIILTPTLRQVTNAGIFAPLGMNFRELDIIVLKLRIHSRGGYHETGIAGAIFEVDAPGWGPVDLTTLPYENIPKDLYPAYRRD